MAFRFRSSAVDAAARDNRDVGIFTDDKFIINNIVQPSFAQNDGYVNGFVYCSRRDGNGNPVLFFTGFYINVRRCSSLVPALHSTAEQTHRR